MNRNIIDDLVLTIINDGDGKLCGMDYALRKLAAKRNDRQRFMVACLLYDDRRRLSGSKRALVREIKVAAQELLDYYVEHNKECEDDET